MADEKVLVVYYSRTGTTKKLAEAIAAALGCETEELVDTKDRKGVKGYMKAGRDAMKKRITVLEPVRNDPAGYDLVILGTPVWAWSMAPAVRTYIAEHKEALGKVAFFLTTGGTGIERTFEHMATACGKEPVATLGLKAKEVKKGDLAAQVEGFVAALNVSG